MFLVVIDGNKCPVTGDFCPNCRRCAVGFTSVDIGTFFAGNPTDYALLSTKYMNSRSILFAGGFCLACVIVLGSAAMQLAVGDARTYVQDDPDYQTSSRSLLDTTSSDSEQRLRDSLSKRRKLEALLRHAEALMEGSAAEHDSLTASGGIPLSDEVVAVFAEMVQVIDESPGYLFEVVVSDPDPGTCLRRAEIIRSALLLALRHPSRLRVTETLSSRPQLAVRTIETPS